MRALIVSNMYPSPGRPALGSFVRDQVLALRRIPDVEVEVFTFAPGGARAYSGAAANLRRRYGRDRFDVVHAHFGLTAWPSFAVPGSLHAVTLHGTDLADPRSRLITLAALRFIDLTAVVSDQLAQDLPPAMVRGEVAVLPAGVDMERFRPIPRRQARGALGLDPDEPCLLFPADPSRREKRHDRAASLAAGVRLLALGNIDPRHVPLWINAANAVLVPSDREGFGLGVLEALACDVPVLATPCGVAPEVLAGVDGAHCGKFEPATWRDAVAPHLASSDPRIAGRPHAERFSSDRMAARLVGAWRGLLASRGSAEEP